jgi:hypothetical protein
MRIVARAAIDPPEGVIGSTPRSTKFVPTSYAH